MIALDANGADGGPSTVSEGAARSDEEVLLFGPEERMGEPGARVHIVDAPEKISGGEEPVKAVRSRPDASIVQAARAVGEGRPPPSRGRTRLGRLARARDIHAARLGGSSEARSLSPSNRSRVVATGPAAKDSSPRAAVRQPTANAARQRTRRQWDRLWGQLNVGAAYAAKGTAGT